MIGDLAEFMNEFFPGEHPAVSSEIQPRRRPRNHPVRRLSQKQYTNRRLPLKASTLTLALGALAVLCSVAQAAEPTQEITITGTRVESIPYDLTTHLPAQKLTVTATVPANLDVLTLNSGVALLRDSVREAAQRACMTADPTASATSDVTTDCVHEAVRGAQPQINALIARARNEAKG